MTEHSTVRPTSRRPRLKRISGRALFAALGCVVAAAACGAGEGADVGSATVPDTFTVRFATSAGPFDVEFIREWSPIAVARVHELVEEGFWEGARLYRVNEEYAQFGYSGRPELDAEWIPAGIPDEQPRASNARGTVSFARGGPGTRSAILFVNRTNNANLDDLQWNGVLGFPPVGRVVDGMEAIDALHAEYGDLPMQWEDSILQQGNPFLDRRFPGLDSIASATVLGDRG